MSDLGKVLSFPERRRDDSAEAALLAARLETEIGPSVIELRKIAQPLRNQVPQTGRVAVELEQQQPAVPQYEQPAPSNVADLEAYHRANEARRQIYEMPREEVRFEEAA